MLDPKEKKKIAILVAGMHRSGTSALTRVLNLSGCDLPKTIPGPDPYNPKGYWESPRFMDLNDDILASIGAIWYDFHSSFDSSWYASPVADAFRKRALADLYHEFGESRLFVLKDPRICRLLPFWIEALNAFDAEVRIVLPLRSPLDVVASLRSRSHPRGLPPAFGHLLWLRYVLETEAASRGFKRVWLRYDTFLEKPHESIDRISAALNLPYLKQASARSKVELFLSRDLRHHRSGDAWLLAPPEVLHPQIKSSFEILDRWCRDDVSSADTTTLDMIKSTFDAMTLPFSYILQQEKEKHACELAELLASKSWRITAPLRWLRRNFFNRPTTPA